MLKKSSNYFINQFKDALVQSQILELKESWILESLNDEDTTLEHKKNLNEYLLFSQNTLHLHFLNQLPFPKIEEIFIHDFDQCYYKFQHEQTNFPLLIEEENYETFLIYLCTKYHQQFNLENPFASFYINENNLFFRATMIHHSCSPSGKSKLFLRFIPQDVLSLNQFNLSLDQIAFIRNLIIKKENIIICGATGCGKTSFISSLINLIPKDEHCVIIEDTQELISLNPKHTRLLQGKNQGTSIKDYVTYSLRMSPDRIILGEIRSHEIVPFILAANNGHKGMLTSLHANSSGQALDRLGTLFCLFSGSAQIQYHEVMKMLGSSINYIIFLENKSVKEIAKVYGHDQGQLIYDLV